MYTEKSVSLASQANRAAGEMTMEAELAGYERWIRSVTEVCEAVGRGDRERRLTGIETSGELHVMATAVNRVLDCLNAALAQREKPDQALACAEAHRLKLADEFEESVQHAVAALAASASEMQAMAKSLFGVAMNTDDRAAAVAVAAEESSVTTRNVESATARLNSAVARVGAEVNGATTIASTAIREASQTKEVMASLAEASKRIGRVVTLISKIAGQTKLLALNASIEAARAGDAGKGFSVVASEVKNLSKQTEAATGDIAKEIDTIQSVAVQAVNAVDGVAKTTKTLGDISGEIANSVSDQLATTGEIAYSVSQVAEASTETSRNISAVTQSSHETNQAGDELLGAAGELSKQAAGLHGSVESFLVAIRKGEN